MNDDTHIKRPSDYPSWDEYYKATEAKSMPWFHAELDADLRSALEDLYIRGGSALDLGTGPGTQAIALAKLGFTVTGADVSESAIMSAAARAERESVRVNFLRDDIVDSKLEGGFDFIFDRGCFHTLDEGDREIYVKTVNNLLNPDGCLFLKCFSHLQPGDEGPHRFTPEKIEEYFSADFDVRSIDNSVFEGNLEPFPKALFCLLLKRSVKLD